MKDEIVRTITSYLDEVHIPWKTKVRERLYRTVAELKPDRPEDGIPGFIAHDVGHNRMKTKTAKFLGKKLGLNSDFLCQAQIQTLAQRINARLFPDISVELLSGEDIVQAYRDYVGGSSCMTGDNCDCVRMYATNPKRFQLLVTKLNGNSARALVSKLDCGKFLMDRIYCDAEQMRNGMIEYARSQQWYYRASRGNRNEICLGDELTDDFSEFVVSDISYNDGEVPYMDTLSCFIFNGSTITIFHPCCDHLSSDGTLDRTDGSIEDFYCDCCESYCSGESHTVCGDNTVCDHCYDNYYGYCDHCDSSVHRDDLYWLEKYDKSVCSECRDECYRECEDCNEWFKSEDMTEVSGGDEVCWDCLENGYKQCEHCGEFADSNSFHLVQISSAETWYCEECFESECFTCHQCGESFLIDLQSPHLPEVCIECDCVEEDVQ